MDLKEVKTKISSVKNISELTSALETFSALKMKKSQKRFLQSRPFAMELAKMLRGLSKTLREKRSIFMRQKKITKVLVCVVASDRGFCGPFNSNILKFADKEIIKLRETFPVEIMPIGKKAIEHYRKTEIIEHSFSGVGDYWELKQTKEISDFFIKYFLEGKYQKIYLFYTHFRSSFVQTPTMIQLFPLRGDTVKTFLRERQVTHGIKYLLEPSPKVILDEIIPVFIEYLIYQFILSANTSEHSARMMAMRNASDNAKGILEELRLKYNKARQEQITSEVCEISSTKEAME